MSSVFLFMLNSSSVRFSLPLSSSRSFPNPLQGSSYRSSHNAFFSIIFETSLMKLNSPPSLSSSSASSLAFSFFINFAFPSHNFYQAVFVPSESPAIALHIPGFTSFFLLYLAPFSSRLPCVFLRLCHTISLDFRRSEAPERAGAAPLTNRMPEGAMGGWLTQRLAGC